MIASINTNNTKPHATSFTGGAPRLFTIKSKKIQNLITTMGNFSTPQSRVIMGATALGIQPFIDWGNKNVDEETRKYSVARTMAKIIAGTLVGTIVRDRCIKAMNNFTCTPEDLIKRQQQSKKISKWNTVFVPKNIPPEQFQEAKRLLKQHRKALGSIVALGAMLFTNFLFDAPLTKFLTNLFAKKMDKIAKEKASKETKKEGGNQ